jgi:hypothetical protein
MPYYFGLNVGEYEYPRTDGGTNGAQAGSSTTSKDIEVVINTNANVPSVEDLLLTIEKLEDFILRSGKAW